MKSRRGTGLYSARQVQHENSITFTASAIGGTVIAATGVALVLRAVTIVRTERHQWGSAELHIGDWLLPLCMIVTGVFVAHAGAIYWWRRLFSPRGRQGR
jgi:hypothetical protein